MVQQEVAHAPEFVMNEENKVSIANSTVMPSSLLLRYHPIRSYHSVLARPSLIWGKFDTHECIVSSVASFSTSCFAVEILKFFKKQIAPSPILLRITRCTQLIQDGVHAAVVVSLFHDTLASCFGVALANMATRLESHAALVQVGSIASLIQLGDCDDMMCRRYATLALGSLAANIDNHEYLLADDQEVTSIPSAPANLCRHRRRMHRS